MLILSSCFVPVQPERPSQLDRVRRLQRQLARRRGPRSPPTHAFPQDHCAPDDERKVGKIFTRFLYFSGHCARCGWFVLVS